MNQWCITEGAAPEVMHQMWCTRGDAPCKQKGRWYTPTRVECFPDLLGILILHLNFMDFIKYPVDIFFDFLLLVKVLYQFCNLHFGVLSSWLHFCWNQLASENCQGLCNGEDEEEWPHACPSGYWSCPAAEPAGAPHPPPISISLPTSCLVSWWLHAGSLQCNGFTQRQGVQSRNDIESC